MRVVLEAGVFARAENLRTLIALLDSGLRGHHRLQIDDVSMIDHCIGMLPRELQDDCRFALDCGFAEDASEPSSIEVVVTAQPRASDHAAVFLNVDSAYEVLMRPFTIFIEDNSSDRAFLLAVARPGYREWLVSRERSAWLTFEHGGGIPSMERQIRERSATYPSFALTAWTMFDSDAMSPGQPSEASNRLRDLCGRLSLRHHQLQRREAENYLPRRALKSWAQAGRRTQRDRFVAVETFSSMNDQQRHHFNMRDGFSGDARRPEAARGLYDDLDDRTHRILDSGSGRRVRELWANAGAGHVSETDLVAEQVTLELWPALDALIELIR